MRILMFPQRTFPCTHAMLESVYARILPARGHEVHWIMRAADHDPRRAVRTWHRSTVETTPLDEGGPLRNALASMRDAWHVRSRFRAPAHGGYQIVQVRNEIGPSLAALRARRRRGFAFVYQLSWLSAEVRLKEAAEGRQRPRAYHLARGRSELLARRRIIRAADAVLAISETMRDDLLEADPTLDPSRIIAFPLGFDASIVPAPSDVAAVRAQLGLGDRPVAVYFGTMSSIRRLDFLVEVLTHAVSRLPDLALLMIGGEQESLTLAGRFADAGLERHVIFTGQLTRAETARHVAAADVSIVPFLPIAELRSSSPLKLIESLGLGVPVVANVELPENARVLGASGGGVLVAYDPAEFAAAIATLIADPERRARQAAAGRAWVSAHRDYEVLATGIERLYDRLCTAADGRRRPGA